jgi:hypothetical protein
VDIPYRLDSIEAIHAAKKEDLLNLGKGYNLMLMAARKVHLHYPQAFRKARESDFTVIKEEKIGNTDISYEEISDLDLAGNLERIESKIPWLKDMARHESTFQYIETFPPDVRKALGLEVTPPSPTQMLEAYLALRRLIKREILHYVKTGRPKSLDLDYLKRLMTAMTLFDSPQQDILHLLKTGATGDYIAPYQNVLAEMLFARLPQTMGNLLMANPLALRQKILARIARLGLATRQRMTLYSYCQHVLKPQQLMRTLVKMRQVSARMSLSPETKQSISDYFDSLKSQLKKISQSYRELFLDNDLEIIRQLHEPGHWLKTRFSYSEDLVKTYTRLATMELYPTKDYLDICKGVISGDCVNEVLGEGHLRESRYFSIRIFMDRQWIGNIYMLDFTDVQRILLVDRIQIPRNLRILYHRFFDHLREAFEELFADVPYESIIVPLAISNHETLQKVFNAYRKKLPSLAVDFKTTENKHFESLNWLQRYYVLVGKKTAA